jgi:flagellar basal-body rod modification protein FlgD
MSIEGLGIAYNATATSATTATKATEKELGKEEFLTLLVAQLKNQDPLNPLDATDFTAQLAQFSSLEQLIEINNNIGDMQEGLTTREDADILDYIGKIIKTNDTTITVDDGVTGSIVYTLDDSLDVNIHIYNDDGIEVRTINAGKQDRGEHALAWDGLNNDGTEVQNGTYIFDIRALSENGQIIPCESYFAGKVTGIGYKGGTPFLMIGTREINPESVIEVKENSG